MKKKVLFAVHLDTFFTGLLGIARMMKERADHQPVMLFAQNYPLAMRDIAVCRDHQLPCLGGYVDPGATRVNRSITWLRTRFYGFYRIMKDSIYDSFPYQYLRLLLSLRRARRIIRAEGIALMVLGGDIAHYDTAAYIKAAHQENIPVVIVAGWMVHQDEHAEIFRFFPSYNIERPLNRLAGRLYPRWVYTYKGCTMLRLPAAHIFARELLGIAPPLPWTLHSGQADAIAVECEAARVAALKEGLLQEKVVVTGSINHDLMARVRLKGAAGRAELYRELGLPDDGRPMLLTALTPDEFHRSESFPECDFRNYDDYVRFWIRSLLEVPGWNIVVCLHPSAVYDDVKYIEQWGVRISRRHTAELIALCNLYVASVSTTIQWATACGTPVVNYDFYRCRLQDYTGIPGVITMEEQDDFRAVLKRITSDRAYYDDMASRQAACSDYWGRLDGHAGDRIISLFDQLIERYGGTADAR